MRVDIPRCVVVQRLLQLQHQWTLLRYRHQFRYWNRLEILENRFLFSEKDRDENSTELINEWIFPKLMRGCFQLKTGVPAHNTNNDEVGTFFENGEWVCGDLFDPCGEIRTQRSRTCSAESAGPLRVILDPFGYY